MSDLTPERLAEIRAAWSSPLQGTAGVTIAWSSPLQETAGVTIRELLAALDAAEKERDELRVDYESSLNASARLMKERDEAYRRVGEADAQRMVALRKNEAAWAQVDALEKERDEAQDALQALRATWNAHFETCSAPLPCGVTMADLEAWRDAPSNTASVTPLVRQHEDDGA